MDEENDVLEYDRFVQLLEELTGYIQSGNSEKALQVVDKLAEFADYL